MFSACLRRSKRHTAVASEATSTTKIMIPVVLGRRPVPLMAKKLANISPMKPRSEEHTSELQSLRHLVCRLLLEKKKKNKINHNKIKNERTYNKSYKRY